MSALQHQLQEDLTKGSLSAIATAPEAAESDLSSQRHQAHVVAALPMGEPTEDEQESLPMAEAVPAYEPTIVAPPMERSVQEASMAAAMAAAATAAAAAVVARAEAATAAPQESAEA